MPCDYRILQKPTKVFACTHRNEYNVLMSVSTRTYESVYVVLTEVFTRIYVIWTVVKWKSCLGYLYDD